MMDTKQQATSNTPTAIHEDIKALRGALDAGPTPGEWHYRSVDEWSHTVVTHHGQLPDGSFNCWTVAEINKRREPEHVANGRLIAAANPARIARLLAALETTREALRGVLGCPYVIEESTVPSSGIDTPGLNLFQVAGTMHVALSRYRSLKAALAQFEGETK